MDRKKRIFKFQTRNLIKSLLVFWLVMILVNFGFLMLNKSSGPNTATGFIMGTLDQAQEDGFSLEITVDKAEDGLWQESARKIFVSIAGINLLALIIYFITTSYEAYYKDYPLALSMSVTRKEFAISHVGKSLIILSISAFLQAIFLKIDPLLVSWAGKNPYYNYVIFNLETDSFIYIFASLFTVFLLIYSLANLLAILNYRLSYMLWVFVIGLNLLAIYLPRLKAFGLSLLEYFSRFFTSRLSLEVFINAFFISLASYFLAYFFTSYTDLS